LQLKTDIKTPPRGLAILAMIGPGLIWCSEMVGSGEVILTTRIGAILGTGVMWAIILGIFLKFWIGLGGARYTVCTGEGMIDMFDRIPGPKHWVVWLVLVVQFISAAIAIGSLAAAAGVFVNSLIPVSRHFGGWLVSVIALMTAWTGEFKPLKMIMSFFVLIILAGVVYVAITVIPPVSVLARGLLMHVPDVPAWAVRQADVHPNPWREILPLMGWAAGGFASQVWYTYWVLGDGYGSASGRGYGIPADLDQLRRLDRQTADKIRGWCRVVYADGSAATLITVILTISFLIAGAGVLGPDHQAPNGPQVAVTLSEIFASKWGAFGGFVFMLTGAVALIGTQMAQLAGWPRLLADAFRICIPRFRRFRWRMQYRLFLSFFFITNMILVFTLGMKPVFLVKLAAVLDGLLLTPLQAVWVFLGLYVVMPKLFHKDIYPVIRPHWIFGVFLILAFLAFGYFCIFQIPFILS
jgi:Mn2+/Fe2+ NRAMP family transporter